MSCPRTQHSGAHEAQTHDSLVSGQALYQLATVLPVFLSFWKIGYGGEEDCYGTLTLFFCRFGRYVTEVRRIVMEQISADYSKWCLVA